MSPQTRDLVKQMVIADPKVSAAAIARAARVSRERVRQLLDDLGYELVCVWRKKRP